MTRMRQRESEANRKLPAPRGIQRPYLFKTHAERTSAERVLAVAMFVDIKRGFRIRGHCNLLEAIMSTADQHDHRAAEEMASEMERRQEARREAERATWRDLNQGLEDPGGYDTRYTGIKWGPSYRVRRKR